MNLTQFFLPILKPHKWWFLLIFQAGFFGSFYSFMWYYAIKILIEKTSLIANNQQIAWQEFIFPVAIFIGAEIFVNTVWRFSNYAYLKSQPYIQKDILLKSYQYLTNHSYQFFLNNNSGLLLSKIRKIVDSYGNLLASMQFGFGCLLIQTIVNIFILLFINKYLGLILFAWFAVAFPIMANMSKNLAKLADIEYEEKHKIIGLIGDNILNINNLFAFASRKKEQNLLNNKISAKVIPAEIQSTWYYMKMHIISGLLYVVAMLVMMIATIWLCYQHQLQVSDLVLIFGVGLAVFDSSWKAIKEFHNVVKQIADLKSAFSIIQIKQQVLDKTLPQELKI